MTEHNSRKSLTHTGHRNNEKKRRNHYEPLLRFPNPQQLSSNDSSNDSSTNFSNDSRSNTTNNSSNSNNDGVELRPNTTIPFIPGGVSYQLKRALNNAGCNVFFKAGRKLQSILCAENKTKPDSMEKSGVYQYTCTEHKIHYVGESKRSCRIRDAEHRKAAENQ